MENYLPWVLVAAGAFCILGAVQDWDWFLESRKARIWVSMFGRGGARVFYGILGAVIVAIGVGLGVGWLGK